MSEFGHAASPACVVIADDLSGACDAGVWFARNGLLTRVALGCAPPDSDVLVVSTDSRRMTAPAAVEQVRVAAARLPLESSALLFKKIDSTFRGHIAAECDALMKVSGARFGLMAPAVPSQRRIVRDGILCVEDITGRWTLDVPQMLREQGAVAATVSPRQCATVRDLADRIRDASASARYVLCDAVDEQDLAMAAEALLSIEGRALWIGASGLASHAARLLRKTTERRTAFPTPAAKGPVVLCVGSNHEVTRAQLERLQQIRGGSVVGAASSAAGSIHRAAEGASHLVLIIDTCAANANELRMLVEEIRRCSPAAVLATGGDTAALLCRAAEAQQLALEDEVVAGVPVGYIEGGLLHGVRFATKSGGFGEVDCLVNCIRLLSSSAMTGAR